MKLKILKMMWEGKSCLMILRERQREKYNSGQKEDVPEYIRDNLKHGEMAMQGLLDGIDNQPDIINYEKLCCKLRDQHQKDCITINQLQMTIDKLVDRYANLRKNVGVD